MSRPLRIEFKDAYYHVMNRGAGRRNIFAHDDHRSVFLELLREAHEMFSAEIHAYCLMDNHYHLLLSTPQANLSRIMRHINGVYTQRYNRLEKTDGPLFRGRYKAILIDADAYLLSVSRYIHLNPVAADMVNRAQQFPWSSYRAFIGDVVPPVWLNTGVTLSMMGPGSRQRRYRQFVEGGIDPETLRFYDRKKQPPVFGRPSFVAKMERQLKPHVEIPERRQVRPPTSISQLVKHTALVFETDVDRILETTRGRSRYNAARGAALYLSRKNAGHSLQDIADYFGLASYGSVSGQIHRFQLMLSQDVNLNRLVEKIAAKCNR